MLAEDGGRLWGLSGEDLDGYADLGYRDAEQVQTVTSSVHFNVLDDRITPERFAVISHWPQAGPGLPSAWYYQALAGADLDALRAALDGLGAQDVVERYLRVLRAHRPDRAERAEQFLAEGIRQVAWIESTHPLPVVAAMRDAVAGGSPKSKNPRKDMSWVVLELLRAGHTPMDVAAYGAAFCQAYTAEQVAAVRAGGTPVRVVRSLFTRLRRPAPDVYAVLYAGGVRTGKDAHAYARVLTTTRADLIVALAAVCTPAPAEQYLAMKDGTALTAQDIPAVAVLAAHGFTLDRLREWVRHGHREASRYHQEDRANMLGHYAAILEAGITPERLGVLTRAGIPASHLAEYADEADPWAAGAPFREHYAAEERRLAASWGALHGPERVWAYAEETYRDPAPESVS